MPPGSAVPKTKSSKSLSVMSPSSLARPPRAFQSPAVRQPALLQRSISSSANEAYGADHALRARDMFASRSLMSDWYRNPGRLASCLTASRTCGSTRITISCCFGHPTGGVPRGASPSAAQRKLLECRRIDPETLRRPSALCGSSGATLMMRILSPFLSPPHVIGTMSSDPLPLGPVVGIVTSF